MKIEAVNCLLCSVTLFWITYSEEYLHFVTPKMKPYLYFASLIFLVWGVYELLRQRKPTYKRNINAYCLLLAIPAFIIISCIYCDHFDVGNMESIESIAEVNTKTGGLVFKGLDRKQKKIIVTNENFLAWINELRMNTHAYTGYSIIMEGNLGLKKEEQAGAQFYLIQWYMSCCAADVVPIGILCEIKNSSSLEEGYIRVEGTVACNHGEEGESAKIVVKRIKKMEAPKEKYIYG